MSTNIIEYRRRKVAYCEMLEVNIAAQQPRAEAPGLPNRPGILNLHSRFITYKSRRIPGRLQRDVSPTTIHKSSFYDVREASVISPGILLPTTLKLSYYLAKYEGDDHIENNSQVIKLAYAFRPRLIPIFQNNKIKPSPSKFLCLYPIYHVNDETQAKESQGENDCFSTTEDEVVTQDDDEQ